VVGEAAGARRQARRTRLRLAVAAAAALGGAALACAYQGDPPGGPPRTTPPRLLSTEPESGAVLSSPPHTAQLFFDEVLSERISGPQPDVGGAVILSPVTGEVKVGWHRNRLTVEPKGGYLPGRVYRLQLLPVLSDLRQNRMRVGRTIVFSTGPAIPEGSLSGAIVDWAGNRAAAGALIEAVLLPDSLPYRTLSDSAGSFTMAAVPPGAYLVYGVLDQNNNRRRDQREAFDTARVTLQDSAAVELYAFRHDTIGPRLRTVDLVDSVTLRITFDRPLDPSQTVDTSMVHVAPADDSTRTLPLLHIYTAAEFDSVTKAEAAERAARDTAQRAAPRDTTRERPAAPVDTAMRRRGGRPAGAAVGERITGAATKMLERRPAPTDNRIVRLASPLTPGSRYVVTAQDVRGLAGAVGPARAMPIRVPAPRPTRPAADTLPARTRGDTLAPRQPRDTTPSTGAHTAGAARRSAVRAPLDPR
jgi:hypothetical protein